MTHSGMSRGVPVQIVSGPWRNVGTYRNRKSVTLDASGNGSVTFDVRSSNQRYVITDIVVSTNQAVTQTPYPTATIYEGPAPVAAGLADGASWTGNQDVFRGRFLIDAGTDLTVAFTGGVVGSVATAVIQGTNELWETLAAPRVS